MLSQIVQTDSSLCDGRLRYKNAVYLTYKNARTKRTSRKKKKNLQCVTVFTSHTILLLLARLKLLLHTRTPGAWLCHKGCKDIDNDEGNDSDDGHDG